MPGSVLTDLDLGPLSTVDGHAVLVRNVRLGERPQSVHSGLCSLVVGIGIPDLKHTL